MVHRINSSFPIGGHSCLSYLKQILFYLDTKKVKTSMKLASNTALVNIMFIKKFLSTVILLSFRTDRSGQTVQTQIRLLLEEQSDQGLYCLQYHLHLFDKIP